MRTRALFSPCLVNGTLGQPFKLIDKVSDQLQVFDLIIGQISGKDATYHHSGHFQVVQIITRAWIQWILENTAENGEEGGHGVEYQRPGKN